MHPQAGKYHYDGHRKCHICWHPTKTAQHEGICPICGKPVTIGVLNRAFQLADRSELPPDLKRNWQYIMPLPEIISRIVKTGVTSKRVINRYNQTMNKGLTEMQILLSKPEDIEEKLADKEIIEFIRHFRSEKLQIQPGYDGEYGRISLS